MSKRKEVRALYEALAENVLASTDQELIEEVRDNGDDPGALAESTRTLLLNTVKTFQQRPLAKARDERARAIQKIDSLRPVLPTDPQLKRAMLIGVLKAQPTAQGVLTAQWREFDEMTDDDVETALLELVHLGFIDPGKNE